MNMKNTLNFLKELKLNNNREWFNAHKDEYLKVKADIEAFTATLISRLSEIEPDASRLSPQDCLYRIYRDTRFSADKTPYKTHIGIYINPRGIYTGGKKSEFCGYYVHIEPGNCFLAGGAWYPPAPLLKEYRSEIYNNVEEYLEIMENPEFAANFKPYWTESLKTAPKGFPKDWEHIELLKPRSFTVASHISERELCSKGIVDKIISLCKILQPYDAFFNYTLEEHPDLATCRPRQRK
ncbi:MAG: DUF2461 domain-containing protein [Muribaculaceae bacterium]|nr:DUF2461 domain-containing protein [Muribaculaceae bacterium]